MSINKLCFINIKTSEENNTEVICDQTNLFSFSNIISIEYDICNYSEGKFINNKSYTSKNDDFRTSLLKLVMDMRKVDIIIGHNIIHQFNSIIKYCYLNKISFNMSKHIIIDTYLWNEKPLNNVFTELKIGSGNISSINKLKKVLLYYYNQKIS